MSNNPSAAVINKALGAPPGSTLCQPCVNHTPHGVVFHRLPTRPPIDQHKPARACSDPKAASLVASLASMLRASQTALLAQASPMDGRGGGRHNWLKEVVFQAHRPPSRSLGLRGLACGHWTLPPPTGRGMAWPTAISEDAQSSSRAAHHQWARFTHTMTCVLTCAARVRPPGTEL